MRQTKHFGKQDKMIPCPCCGEGQLSLALHIILEDIKTRFNYQSVVITSGARCLNHHQEIYKKLGKPPTKNSDHLIDELGDSKGVDIHIPGLPHKLLYNYLDSCSYSDSIAIGLYDWGVHLGARDKKARW